jgi:hypothetical protein
MSLDLAPTDLNQSAAELAKSYAFWNDAATRKK